MMGVAVAITVIVAANVGWVNVKANSFKTNLIIGLYRSCDFN